MSHGNRNLALARSRYTLTLCSQEAQLISETVTADRVVSETYQFNNSTMYDIDPKYQSACVKLRSLHILTEKYKENTDPPAPTLTGHANLDGADDHLEITLPDNTSVLSWTEDWSLAYHMIEIHNPTEGTKRTIATRGNNGMYFSKGSGNWGFYASATDGEYDPASNEGMTHSHGANTWFVPPDDSKHLFTYKSSTGKLRWYCNDVLKATVQMTSVEMTKGVLATDKLNVGDQMSGYYGSSYWDGRIDDLLIMSTNLVDTSPQITEYFADTDYDAHLEYSDKILSWFKLDPDPANYPAISDSKSFATGEHVGGNVATSFVTTGEAAAVAVQDAVSVAVQDGAGTPYVYFKLNTAFPNNSQSELPQSIGPSTVLAVVPTSKTDVLGTYVASRHTFEGTVAECGKLCSGTVVNNDLRIEIESCLLSDNGPVFGLGPEREVDGVNGGIVNWIAELEIQLLVNAPDVDSMDLG